MDTTTKRRRTFTTTPEGEVIDNGDETTTTTDERSATEMAEEAAASAPKQSEALVRMADGQYDVFSATGEGNGRLLVTVREGPNLAFGLRGTNGLRQRLAASYRRHNASTASQNALAEAMTAIEGQALDGQPRSVHRRVAWHDGSIVVDLGTPSGEVVVITPAGWTIENRSPVTFVRTAGLALPMPRPRHGGSLDGWRTLLNVSAEDWPLVLAWLVHGLMPGQAHTILRLLGEQGSCKSTTARLLVGLIDPSTSILRSEPSSVRDWAVTAAGSWSFCLDNLSWVPSWLSDALCRAVTGESVVSRMLYTDDEISVLTVQRVVAITTIGLSSTSGDLAERCLPIEVTPPTERRTDEEIAAAAERLRPRALGALFDLTARVLAELPTLTLRDLPRMADFGKVCAAVGRVITPQRDVLGHFHSLSESLMAEVAEGSALASALRGFLSHHGDEWSGTPTELLDHLDTQTMMLSKPKGWPRTAEALGSALRRLAPAMRRNGIEIVLRKSHGRRVIDLRDIGRAPVPTDPTDPRLSAPELLNDDPLATPKAKQGDGGDGGDGSPTYLSRPPRRVLRRAP